jgi:hypothetical protein
MWLRKESWLEPLSVMSDCAIAIANSVEMVYADLKLQAPKHYWCVFHVLKAFVAQAKIHLRDQAPEAIKSFRAILYSSANPQHPFIQYWLQWRQVSRPFANYLRRQWAPRLSYWGFHYRTVSFPALVSVLIGLKLTPPV